MHRSPDAAIPEEPVAAVGQERGDDIRRPREPSGETAHTPFGVWARS